MSDCLAVPGWAAVAVVGAAAAPRLVEAVRYEAPSDGRDRSE